MRTFILSFVLVLCIIPFNFIVSAQVEPQKDSKNFTIHYNQQAHYPAGDAAFYKLISESMKYSEEAKRVMLDGTILISFDVMPDSTLSNFVILSSPGYGTDQELIRVLKPLKFAPAMANGYPIRQNVILSIPVRAGILSR